MKTSFTYLAIAALTVGTLATADAQIGIGIRGGILTTSEKIDNATGDDQTTDIFDESNVTGYTVGIPIEIAISNVFSIQPEFNFQSRGTSFTQRSNVSFDGAPAVSVNQDFDQSINYLEIPLLFKLGYTTDRFTVAAVFGPSLSYAIGGTREFSNYTTAVGGTEIGGNIAQEVDVDFDEFNRKRIDVGGQVGLQGGIPAGPGKIILDARYQVGFSNLNDGDDTNNDSFDDYDAKGRGFSATLGYMFTLGDY